MEEHYDDLLARSRGVAEDQGIFLATGAGILFPDDERMPENRLMLIAPSGEIVMDHLKFGATLVDGIAPGDGILRTVDTPYGTLSGIVCYDGDFPMIVKQAGRNGTDILLIAHGEPNVGAAQLHAQQHIFRAIENGVSVFRADSVRGLSFATDPYGRILAMTNNLTASERAISAQVPTHGVFTLYSVIGDLFGWMSVAGFAVTVAWAVVRGRRAKRAESSQSEGQMPS
jgi:apolipoprotein N-acyltransferase